MQCGIFISNSSFVANNPAHSELQEQALPLPRHNAEQRSPTRKLCQEAPCRAVTGGLDKVPMPALGQFAEHAETTRSRGGRAVLRRTGPMATAPRLNATQDLWHCLPMPCSRGTWDLIPMSGEGSSCSSTAGHSHPLLVGEVVPGCGHQAGAGPSTALGHLLAEQQRGHVLPPRWVLLTLLLCLSSLTLKYCLSITHMPWYFLFQVEIS